jgi:heterodisulfide reductase subunit A-like polyferredoxin
MDELEFQHVSNCQTENVNGFLTRRGEIQKQTKQDTSAEEINKIKLRIQKKKHSVTPPCQNCRRRCAGICNYENKLWNSGWKGRRIFVSANTLRQAVKHLRNGNNSERLNNFKYYMNNE